MKFYSKIEKTDYFINIPKLPDNFNGFKILQLSDLHSRIFDAKNQSLLESINKVNPDIIVMTGDMLNAKHDDGMVCINIVKALNKKYPIYFVLGNHEQHVEAKTRSIYTKYIMELNRLGVTILNNSKMAIIKGINRINMFGMTLDLSLYWKTPVNEKEHNFFDVGYIEKKLGVCKKEEVNILLVHNPKYFGEYSNWGADLIFSGHVHGGIIRLPYFGGLLSPDRTFFPKYDWGIYKNKDSKMIVSRGLGNSHMNFRLNNKPEIVVVTLKKERILNERST